VQLRGHVVLVNFWATWCLPCRVEMPGFQAVYDRKKDEGFVVLGISTDAGGRDGVVRFLKDHGITYPVALASGDVAQRFGGVNLLPSSFLMDRKGRIRSEVRGIFSSIALDRAVDRLLAEPPTISEEIPAPSPGDVP
jgi:peroxiredoxin